MRRFRAPDELLRATLADGEEVLLNPATSTYHMLNATGSVLFAELSGGATFEQAVAALAARTTIDTMQARADAEIFVDEMTSRGLLEAW